MNKNQLTNAMKVVIANMAQSIQAGKTDEEVLSESKVDKIGDKDCTDELLSDLLEFAHELANKEKSNNSAKSEPKSGKMFGNKDKDEKYAFPTSWGKMVVVRESIVQKIGPKDSDVVEVPSSIQLKPFDALLFDMHVKSGMFKNKKVEILHDPR